MRSASVALLVLGFSLAPPAACAGTRFRLTDDGVNVRLDAGLGQEGGNVHFALGEAQQPSSAEAPGRLLREEGIHLGDEGVEVRHHLRRSKSSTWRGRRRRRKQT